VVVFFLELVLLTYFSYFVVYNLVLSIAGLFYKSPQLHSQVSGFKKFAVFIPAYKEDGVILETAKKAFNQSYPKEFYDVVVIGDSLQPETMETLRSMPLTFIPVSFEKSTKVKALNTAMAAYKGNPDYAVILDADNVMDPDFLTILNNLHIQGKRAVQGRRAAKNKSNSLSFLDGLSEEINNHMLGKGGTALGLSSALKGSGMSFEFNTLRELLGVMVSVGGFDRELELMLIRQGTKVYYADSAIVYDEKVEKRAVFENQRKRWISSQYFYLRKYFVTGIQKLFRGDLTFFNSAVLRNIQLPRLINLGLLSGIAVVSLFISAYLTSPWTWPALFAVAMISTLMAIPREYFTYQLLISLFTLPAIFVKMTFLLFKAKGANKTFIHTPHQVASVRK